MKGQRARRREKIEKKLRGTHKIEGFSNDKKPGLVKGRILGRIKAGEGNDNLEKGDSGKVKRGEIVRTKGLYRIETV